jgi:transcriptional regulator with XRE-family HTH domain
VVLCLSQHKKEGVVKNGMNYSKRKIFGAFLLSARKKSGLSLREAALHCHVPFGVLASIERGEKAKISMDMLAAAAALYGLDFDNLCLMCERIPQDIFYKITNLGILC